MKNLDYKLNELKKDSKKEEGKTMAVFPYLKKDGKKTRWVFFESKYVSTIDIPYGKYYLK